MSTLTEVLASLESVCTSVIAPAAVEIDRAGAFPQQAINALTEAGILGAFSAPEVGGHGLGHAGAAAIVGRIAQDCASTAMVVCMHYCGTAVLEGTASPEIRKAAASGRHLSTLAFSEAGSRSHFWAPVSTASVDGEQIRLDARKSWITSANQATAFVWSSKPVAAEGASTLWLVPNHSAGLAITGPFDGLGLRGNDSAPATAAGLHVAPSAMLGKDGGGFDLMMGTVLPLFSLCNAAVSLGLMEAACVRTIAHVNSTQFAEAGTGLGDLPTIRSYVAQMRVKTDMVRTLLDDSAQALATGRADAMLRVLEIKAAAGEAATQVLDTAMRVCGGAAFRKDVGVERAFRDARAAGVMAPTTDVLYDFIGKAVLGQPLF